MFSRSDFLNPMIIIATTLTNIVRIEIIIILPNPSNEICAAIDEHKKYVTRNTLNVGNITDKLYFLILTG